jgi:hypothetical protein
MTAAVRPPKRRHAAWRLVCLPLICSLGSLATAVAGAESLPDGYWDREARRAVLEATRTVRLEADMSALSAGERVAVQHLLGFGEIMQSLYERQLHREAPAALLAIGQLPASPARTELLKLYRLFRGPIATTLDNRREAFAPVAAVEPGKGVYPPGLSRAELDRWLDANPEQRERLLDARSVVRRADRRQVDADLAMLDRHPALDLLHPGLRARLERLRGNPRGFYALPYAVAWADEIVAGYRLLHAAADAVSGDDREFAGYLRHRARDLLTDDYEAGDAAWITGQFGNLNAQIGAYEVYDDELLGVRTFFSLSLLVRRQAESAALADALGGLQAIHDALPLSFERKVREEIPVGVYDVIADFGQSRGGNTATILPNDALHARRYGRVILMRDNIMRHPDNLGQSAQIWQAAVLPAHHDDLQPGSGAQRTLWHEIGHYLGVDRTADGRDLDHALQELASLFEEMKADLVSLHAARQLHADGYYDDAGLRGVYASGVLRVLQRNPPRRDQPYGTMQLMQWNWFLAHGLLGFDPEAGRLSIDYERYHEVARSLLAEVLAIQAAGDRAAAEAFVERWAQWDEALHGAIAARIRAALRYRYTLYRYQALGE